MKLLARIDITTRGIIVFNSNPLNNIKRGIYNPPPPIPTALEIVPNTKNSK